mgnify:CR=1 FL=1
MSVQHYLITGGTGFIGRALCRQLAQQHRVTVVSRQARPTGLAEGVRCLQRPQQLDPNDHVDVVINLAGESLGPAAGPIPASRNLVCRDCAALRH